MSPRRWVTWGAASFLTLIVCARGLAAPVEDPPKDPATALAELRAQYDAAQEEFFAPYANAKTQEEADKIVLDFTKEPGRIFAPKFLEFANAHEGTPVGAQALLVYLSVARDKDATTAATARFVELYAKSDAAAEFAQQLPMFAWTIGAEATKDLATTIYEESELDTAKSWALFARGQAAMEATPDQARADLSLLQKAYGETPAGARAAGLLFELDHLQVGMVAPDFDAVDQDDKAWKLSDYRGKVVVIDFWGFW